MTRKQLSILFLALFLQAVFYPAVIFHMYVEAGEESAARSLPVDFPDNGNSCYFGLNNNEEETSGENVPSVFNESFQSTNFPDLDAWNKMIGNLVPDHQNLHPEITTPPPEVI